MWQPRLIEGARLKYLGIVAALEADIRAGRVPRGERLPPQRAIAAALGVDLTTVTRAFNEARRRGLIDAHVGRGTFIREGAEGIPADGGALDLSMNAPPQPAEPDVRRLLPQTLGAVLASPRGPACLAYQESAGAAPDRHAAALWLAGRIEAAAADRVLVAPGAQSALSALCSLLLQAGGVIAAGALTYPGLKAVAQQQGLVVAPLAMDAHGILPDALEKACCDTPPKALYVIPSIDNPTTATLPEERRRQIAAIARRHGVTIIEDDPYAPLRPQRTVAIADLAPGLTWHIATLSKCATPALRVAYVLSPSAALALRLAGVLRAAALMASPALAAVASRWIHDGTLEELTRAIRVENAARQRLAAAVLGGTHAAADPHGPHLWLRLPARLRAQDFVEQAERAGVSIVPCAAFATTEGAAEGVRISLGVAPDRGSLQAGLTRLIALLSQPSLDTRAVV